MLPDSLNTNNTINIEKPIKIELSINKDTMIYSGLVLTGVLLTALKIFK